VWWIVPTQIDAQSAREFVKAVALPEPPPVRFDIAKAAPTPFDIAKDQASVVGSDVIAFAKGVTPETRSDIVNAVLLAQLVAKKSMAEPQSLEDVGAWYESYFDTLSRIGFVIQDKGFAEYQAKSDSFEAHEAIIEVASALLVGSPGALALVKTTLGALQKMSADSPWITLFHRESQSANTARFQVSLVESDATGVLLTLIAFGLQAQSRITQVLFFKFHKNDVTLRHNSGQVTINAPLLAGIRSQVAAKIVAYTNEFIERLPDL
jgi:hypothetical protein